MHSFKQTNVKIIFLLFYLCISNSCTKVEGIKADKSRIEKYEQAPAECLVIFLEFFNYVQKPEPSILTDESAQTRWLSKLLRKALSEHLKRFSNPAEEPDYPSNSTFVGVWSYPTTYSIVGSRHYDYRDIHNLDDNRAVIDVLYQWDEQGSLDNQYPGSKSLHSFIFVYENGGWKLDDIYTFTDEYASPGSLRSYFEKNN